MNSGILIGVDGGGTHTRAIAANMTGTVLARAEGAGINYNNIGVNKARENLKAAVDELRAKCGGAEIARIVVGMSALDGAADKETRARFAGDAFDVNTLELQSDAYAALMGATRGAPGAIAICGTGSMLLLLDEDGRQHVSGGWGYALGDAASAYTLAVEGLRAAIAAWEGTGAQTRLCEAALEFYGVSRPRDIIEKFYHPTLEPGRAAKFAKSVLALIESDEIAREIARENVHKLAKQLLFLLRGRDGIREIGIYGGVFEHSAHARKWFSEYIAQRRPDARVALPAYPPEAGAVICALKHFGALTRETLSNLKATKTGEEADL